MRKLLLGVAGAAMLALASGANAATVVEKDEINSTVLNTFLTENFGATLSDGGAFSIAFDFNLTDSFIANSQISSIMLSGIDIDFSSIFLDGFAFTQTQADTDPPSIPGGQPTEVWTLTPAVTLSAGLHTITVNGNLTGSTGNGSFGGNLNVSAIPEPAVWGMMIIGFAGIGSAMRRRKVKPVVSFA